MLIDKYGRVIDYIRVSVTERCNFRCQYCMPDKPFEWVPKQDILCFEDLFEVVRIGIDNGMKKVRITGGEPTLRDKLEVFIKMIYDYMPDVDLAMTTNGSLLKENAQKYKDAGLKRINISLDSLKKETIHHIAGKDVFDTIINGIDEALKVGLKVKFNSVPLKDVNSSEVVALLEYAKSRNISIRFIEYMKNSFANPNLVGLKSAEVLQIIRDKYNFTVVPRDTTSPAQYYRLDDGYEFGIIEPYKDDFCKSCNRIRLSAEGDIIPCLYFDEAQSVKDALLKKDSKKVKEVLDSVLASRPEKNRWVEDDGEESSRAFYETGG